MRIRWRRTGLATLLTAVAVIAPCAAWFVAGSRAVEQESRRITDAPLQRARATACRLADQVAARLEALAAIESRRPFQHYGAEPGSAERSCECLPGTASPLAQGLADPLVRAHFQVDAVGRLTLPTLLEDHADHRDPAWTRDQYRVFEALQCAAMGGRESSLLAAQDGPVGAREDLRPILVGPFRWVTAPIDGTPGLVAMREVSTPSAVLTQGFVVSAAALERLLSGSPLAATLVPGEPVGPSAAALPIDGAQWHVAVDASAERQRAGDEAAGVRRRFVGTFLAGTLAALLAGCSVVGLVWQSERLARQRSRFAAAAAHELNTPLAGLRMYGEMLAEGLGEPARRGEYSRRIAAEAGRLGRVVNNVLGYSRLDRGRLSASPQIGDLGDAVGRAVDALRPALEDGGVTLRVAVEPELPPVRFDRDAVTQMLQNLLDNAEKYTRGCTDRSVDVTVANGDGGVWLTVRDRGPGVPAAFRHRLFRPFVREDSADAPPGLGLGLAMVRELARAQRAELSYRDAPGGGACFRVHFRG